MSKEILLTRRQVIRKTVIAFIQFFVLMSSGVAAWLYIKKLPLDNGLLGGVQPPIRDVLNANENVFNKTLSDQHLAKTYPTSMALKKLRVNGDIGITNDFDPSTWSLNITKKSNKTLSLSLDDIKKLPKTEICFDFKCIEGWSQITHWGGVKFSDLMKAYNLSSEAASKYVGMATADYDYYVGLDMDSAVHPQTLLCYEMNGKPLPIDHGYPLRLIVPVKYGVKSIKRVGEIYFDDIRPDDYWFQRGYDYYLGL